MNHSNGEEVDDVTRELDDRMEQRVQSFVELLVKGKCEMR